MRIYLLTISLISILSFIIGCGTDNSAGESNSLTLKTEDIQSKFTIELKVNNIGTGENSPYMVTYGIIDKEKIQEKSEDKYGMQNTGYEATILSKNAGNNGTSTTTCIQTSISLYDYIEYKCDTTLTNGTKTSNSLILMMGKTYVLYIENSFMSPSGISITTDEKFENIKEIKL